MKSLVTGKTDQAEKGRVLVAEATLTLEVKVTELKRWQCTFLLRNNHGRRILHWLNTQTQVMRKLMQQISKSLYIVAV